MQGPVLTRASQKVNQVYPNFDLTLTITNVLLLQKLFEFTKQFQMSSGLGSNPVRQTRQILLFLINDVILHRTNLRSGIQGTKSIFFSLFHKLPLSGERRGYVCLLLDPWDVKWKQKSLKIESPKRDSNSTQPPTSHHSLYVHACLHNKLGYHNRDILISSCLTEMSILIWQCISIEYFKLKKKNKICKNQKTKKLATQVRTLETELNNPANQKDARLYCSPRSSLPRGEAELHFSADGSQNPKILFLSENRRKTFFPSDNF